MQLIESITEKPLISAVSAESGDHPKTTAIRMRALRRKARRISAYARFNVEMLTAIAVEVESDLAALRH